MHNPYKKVIASLLLFTHMLTSCYNPNIGMGKQALPAPADPTYKQRQYEEEPYSKYREKPTSHIFTTADNHPIKFTYLNGRWQAEVKEYASNGSWQRRQLPVFFEPGLALEDVVNSNPTQQKLLLHICPDEDNTDQPGYVYVGREPSQAKSQPQLLSTTAARQAATPSEVGLAQQQATTQPKQGGTSPQQAQEQPGPQAVLALPSPVQQIGEGTRSQEKLRATPARATSKPLLTPSSETPSQRVAKKQPTSAQQAPSRKALSLRNQNKLLHSQRGAQAKREERAAVEEVSKRAQPAEPRQAIVATPTQPPSLADKAPQGIASQNFLAQGGQQVRFIRRDGQWEASVRERIGVFSRVMMLPVACEGHGDIEAALLALQEQPARYTQRRIHVLPAAPPYLSMVYLGVQGLLGGMRNGTSEPSGSDEHMSKAPTGEQEDAQGSEPSQSASQDHGVSVRALQERMAQGDITSTAALVKAFNAAQAPEEQEALQQWIQRYIAWFNDQAVGNLTQQQGVAIHEYSLLARIRPDNPAHKQLLRDYFNSLCNKIDKEYKHGEEPLIQALEYTLQNMVEYILQNDDSHVFGKLLLKRDPGSDVFEGASNPLIQLGNKLLAKLDPDSNAFTKANYPTHRSTLYALHQALVLIKLIDPGQWDPKPEGGLYQRFREQYKAIAQAAQYYPLCYHARLLKQSLRHLESAKDLPEDIRRRLGHGLKAIFYLYEGAPIIPPYFKPNLDKLLDGCKNLKAAFGPRGIRAKPWYDWLLDLSNATLLTLKDPSQYEDFEKQLRDLKDKGGTCKEKDRTTLRFGIVQQLRMLALHGPTAKVRKQSMKQLKALTNSWSEDAEVMEGLLDGLTALTIQSQGAEKKEAEAALKSLTLTDSPVRPARRRFSPPNSARRKAAALESIIQQWLGEQSLEEKLRDMTARAAVPASGHLFSTINRLLREEALASQAPADAQKACKALREYYQHPDFAQVRSLFAGEAPKHVDSFQCQLMLIEQVKKQADHEGQQDDLSTHHEGLEWVKNPIPLEDLFKRRSTKPGEPARAIHKVLLVGDAGTGKTTLSRRLAYRWAQQAWGKEFQAVYVLPVRALQKDRYDDSSMRRTETLATAIANNCFPRQNKDEEYERLWDQISEELEKPTTLVVLDGLDERYGASESLLGQAKAGSHKLLLLSRPYGIEQERTLVDLEIEHVGLSDGQIETYVGHNLSPDLGAELLSFIRAHPAIAEIAHVPVNLQILCCLWRDNQASVRQAASNGSLPGLYRRLTEYIWERYARKWALQYEDCEELFDTLGKIALDALKKGEVLISEGLVRDHVQASRIRKKLQAIQAAGFLLLQSVGRQYQFPHLTFQEYFAGRSLARQLLSGNDEDQAEVQAFFSEHKYESQYGRMLSFFSGEVSKAQKKKGVNGIRQVLSLVEAAPREVVGVQHLLLEMRLLNEWLCVAEKKREEGLDKLEEEFHVMDSLEEWFSEGLDRVRRADDSSWDDRKLLSLLTTGLQSSRAVAAHAPALLEPLLGACKDSYSSVRRAAREALRSVVQAAPAHAPALLEPLLGACKDSYYHVRRAAISALVSVVKAAPEHAPAILEPLRAACKDSYYDVRNAAREALGSVVQAAPDLLESLLGACKDSDYNVRSAAIEALGSVVQAAPAHAPALLKPLLGACKDSYYSVRRAAREALGSVVQAAPEHAPALLEPLLGACKDSDYSVRSAAREALGSVVQAAPEHAPALLEPLLGACKDSYYDVRSAAISALGSVVQAASEHAPALLKPLRAACKDLYASVRRAAISALGSVVQAAPEHAPALLEPLQAACKDSDASVRNAAISALGLVVQAAPEHALALLGPLQAACKDSDADVRSAAISALGSVVQAAPEHVPALLEPLRAACKDSYASVRSAAISALGSVVQAAPEHALALLEPLRAVCKDSYASVRSAAISALGSVVQAAPAHVPALLEPLRAACKDAYYDARLAAISALGSVVQAAPEHAPTLLEPLRAVCKDSDASVRSAALSALGSVVQAAPEHASALLGPLQAACKDSYASVRSAAREALVSVVQAAPEHTPALLEPLRAACKDSDASVRRAAREALGEVSLQQLIETYWATQNQALIPLIALQLYRTPLLVRNSPKTHHQRIVLYPTAGQSVEWEKPQQEVQHFVQQIKSAAKQK